MKPLSVDEILSNPLNQAIINYFYTSWASGEFGNKTKALFLDLDDYIFWYITLPYEPQSHDIHITDLRGADMDYENYLPGDDINDFGFKQWYNDVLYPWIEMSLESYWDREYSREMELARGDA